MKNKLFLVIISIVFMSLVACNVITSRDPFGLDNDQTYFPTDRPSYEGLEYSSDEILVRATSFEGLEDILFDLGSEIIQSFPEVGWALIKVPADVAVLTFMKELENQEKIILAEPNLSWELHGTGFPEIGPSDEVKLNQAFSEVVAEDYEKLWGMPSINADKAWEITCGDPNVIIAVVDSGLDLEHPEFADHEIIAAYDATEEGFDVQDKHGHGTHVTGTAAANGRSGKLAGVAWDCPVMPIKVMDSKGTITSDYMAKAMLYVADFVNNNPEYRAVINISIGGRGYSHFFKDAIDYAIEAGVPIITSAGNDYKRVLSYPSAYNGVVSVAAMEPYGERAIFSTYGFWVSVAAPGVRIWSSYKGGGYIENQGTSMASPHVCGAAALLLSHNPDLSPLQVKNQIEETARPGYYGEGFCEQLGYGILDVEAMLGPLAPMKYGSLRVETDLTCGDKEIDYGFITVFDSTGKMTYFGATGVDGTHNFYAMLPGIYNVTFSYDNKVHDQTQVEIIEGSVKTIQLNLDN